MFGMNLTPALLFSAAAILIVWALHSFAPLWLAATVGGPIPGLVVVVWVMCVWVQIAGLRVPEYIRWTGTLPMHMVHGAWVGGWLGRDGTLLAAVSSLATSVLLLLIERAVNQHAIATGTMPLRPDGSPFVTVIRWKRVFARLVILTTVATASAWLVGGLAGTEARGRSSVVNPAYGRITEQPSNSGLQEVRNGQSDQCA